MAVLVTGGNGFLGTALCDQLVAQGKTVVSLSRSPGRHDKERKVIGLRGDITRPGLGASLTLLPERITDVYHLAAVHDLGKDKDGRIRRTNVEGTRNVIEFCREHEIEHLYHCSTAYTTGRNPYEESKREAEDLVAGSNLPHVTIFKPSIIMGAERYEYFGHFTQFVMLIVRVHRSVETVRRWIEAGMRLPVIRPVFRIPGDPDGLLNLIPVANVAGAMATITKNGTFWLTNPSPPSLGELVEWVSDVILVDVKLMQEPFPATPIEGAFQKLAAPFLPYMCGDCFFSSIPTSYQESPIDRNYIKEAVKRAVLLESKATEV